ncbi:HMG-box (high mobility group) DNA-binding family protein [Trifolium repens]|nr:HMG-box (high mobility group) DNA-binding family protein [Trifolium repens]
MARRRRRKVKKRVCAIPRAPDGSAFFNCGTCGVSVAISLADMHYCESNKMEFKRFFGIVVKRTFPKNNQQLIKNQPISPYRLFMESFMKGQDMENYNIKIDRIGFEKWKNMSEEEKQPFVSRARELDYKHQEALKQEADEIIKSRPEAVDLVFTVHFFWYGADSPMIDEVCLLNFNDVPILIV